jgi:hypothetical protein
MPLCQFINMDTIKCRQTQQNSLLHERCATCAIYFGSRLNNGNMFEPVGPVFSCALVTNLQAGVNVT